ncbi:MAG TPA: PDZ domain-containing protein [Pirellulales bacterium]|nr:PDZ domain-containing protein [Pirellulales bacterium]
MRSTTFRWLKPAVCPLTAAGLALLLATGAAQAQEDSKDSDANASSSSAARDSDNDRDADRNRSQDRDNDRGDNDRDSQPLSGNYNNAQYQAALGVVFFGSNSLQIRRVAPDSPADDAGLRRGDDILSVDGRRVNTPQQLAAAVRRAGDNEQIKIGVLRDGTLETLPAKLASRAEVFGENAEQYSSRNQDRRRRQYFSRNPQAYDNPGWYEDEYGRGGYPDNRGYARQRGGYYDSGYGNQGYGSRYGNQGQGDDGPGYGAQGSYGTQTYNERGFSDNNRLYEPNYRNAPPGYREEEDRFAPYRRNRRGVLGVTLDEEARGPVPIDYVYRDGPADQAGLRPGDEIVAVDGREIQSTEDLLRVLSRMDAGEQIRLAIDRNGRRRTIRATLESPSDVFAMEEQERGYRMTRSPNQRYDREDYLDGRNGGGYQGGSRRNNDYED